MMLATLFLCAAVTLIAAAEGHVIPSQLETSELSLPPLVGSELVELGRAKRDTRVGGCPYGWTRYGGRCFVYVPSTRNWGQAEINCMSMGGHLASVHSTAEYYFIQDEIRRRTHGFPHTWIGGHDATQRGLWLWTDGTRFDYFNWAETQPDNCCGGQYCLAMNWGNLKGMDDDLCRQQRPSVCARSTYIK